jgi:cytochrome c biogenesis protein ResB
MLKSLSSPRITVVGLLLLFILTFWGTIAQVHQGLFEAQQRYFTSFFFLAGGWFPFPGGQLVLWVLFVNLVAALIDHFMKRPEWTYIGSKIAHLGLILYFVAAFFIFHFSQESYIHLAQGQTTTTSFTQGASAKHYPLPFSLKLDHFKAEFHPGTDVPKSFESLVTISTGSLTRQVRIYMNNPLRYKDYTIYQASYDTDADGRQYSTLAVVKNPVKILPYISCLVVFLGLALHFLIQAFVSREKR